MTNLEKLRTATPEQITEMFCHEYLENCSACPYFARECCNGGKNGFEEWLNKEAKTQKDAPEDVSTGWIKLKSTGGIIYIEASEIVALGPTSPDASVVMNGAVTKVYTRGAEDEPWFVYDTIDEIIEKIKKEYKCLKCFSLA